MSTLSKLGRRSARRFATITVLAGAAAALIGLSAGPAAAGTVTAVPRITGGPVTSDWASGYAAVPQAGGATAFTHIQDSYVIPRVNCAKTAQIPQAVAQFRTGLDGISDGTIEHLGVSATCHQAEFQGYAAWYQMAPAAAVTVFHPKAGDHMQASVTVTAPGTYRLTLTDLTHPLLKFSVTQLCASCQDSSAQVTAGPPPPGPAAGGIPPADFGTVHFSGITVTDSGNVSGGLSNPNWGTDTLITPIVPKPYTLAGPLTTVAGHSAFPDAWK
jgi:hypothetical protein